MGAGGEEGRWVSMPKELAFVDTNALMSKIATHKARLSIAKYRKEQPGGVNR